MEWSSGTHPAPEVRALVPMAPAAIVAGTAGLVGLHVTPQLSPVRDLISDYYFLPLGWLLPASLAVIALGAGVLALVLARAGADPRAALLVAVWAGCVVLIGAFPTDPPGEPLSLSGSIHRYAAFLAFVALPAAGLLVARRTPWPNLVRGLSLAAYAALGLVTVPYVTEFLGERMTPLPQGLVQRAVVGCELVLIALLCRYARGARRRGSRRTRRRRSCSSRARGRPRWRCRPAGRGSCPAARRAGTAAP